ncbi:YciI family protein [Angustibacter sp. McL0619]|uniref:YciI family protein n=1 Tax=Angustibacter sp. McL0619 TaxID=3415676 RepID=UPI003CFAA7B7
MKQYLLSVYQPEGPMPDQEFLDQIQRNLDELNAEMRAAGAWVFSGGLHSPSTATVLRAKDDEVLTTDGPFLEGKEYLGGFTIVNAPDLDAALEWGRRLTLATTLPIEVRPFYWQQG